MDRVNAELVAPLEIARLRAEAARERVAAAACPVSTSPNVLIAPLGWLGRRLIAGGGRLERIGHHPSPPGPLAADLCGCAA